MSQRSRVWWWITCGAGGEEAETLLQDLRFVPGWEQQPFVYPAGLRYSAIYTVNSPRAFCDLASVSILRTGEVNANLLLIRWRAVQKCQPHPFHPLELRSLLTDWRGTPCPFPRNKLLAFSSFLENETSVGHSKKLLHGGQAPSTQKRAASSAEPGFSLAHHPWWFPWHLGARGKRQSPWRGALWLQNRSFPCAALVKVANTHGSWLFCQMLGVRDYLG